MQDWGYLSLPDQTCFYCIAQIDAEWNSLTMVLPVCHPCGYFLGLATGGFSGAATAATPLPALYLSPLEEAALLLPLVLCQDAISLQVYWRGATPATSKSCCRQRYLASCMVGCLRRTCRMTRCAYSVAPRHSPSSVIFGCIADTRRSATGRSAWRCLNAMGSNNAHYKKRCTKSTR